ncbi:ATP-binding cassette domain-containing protein [Actinomadura keratinilytica]
MRAHTSPVLVADNLCFAYPGERGGIRSASLALSASVTASVRGPSGSGKSTLLALLGLILTPASGTLSLAGTDTGRLSRENGTAFASRGSAWSFRMWASCRTSMPGRTWQPLSAPVWEPTGRRPGGSWNASAWENSPTLRLRRCQG